MTVWDIKLDREEIVFGNALVSLYRIESDQAMAERELEHSHSYYELHMVLRDGHTYTIGNQTVFAQPGEMVLIPPDTVHKAIPLTKKNCVAVLSVSVRLLPEGECVYDSLLQRLDACAATAIPLNAGLMRLIEDYGNPWAGRGNVFHRKLSACEILVGIADTIGYGAEKTAERAQVDFDMMLETLVCNSNVPLYEIAQRLGYSLRQTSRIIQKRYGKTFAQLRKEKK